MSLLQRDRDFYHLEMCVNFTPKPKYLTLERLKLEGLIPLFKKSKNREITAEKGTVSVRLQDVKDTDELVILFLRMDGTGYSDVAFSQRGSSQVRSVGPNEDENRCYSAHLIIRKGASDRYEALLERVPGLGITRTQRYLRSLLSDTDSRVTLETEGVNPIKVRPLITFMAYPSDTLKAAVFRGNAKRVKLSRRVDADLEIERSREEVLEIQYVPVAQDRKARVWERIAELFQNTRADDRAKSMRVVVEDGGQQKSVEVDLEEEDLELATLSSRLKVRLEDEAKPLDEGFKDIRLDLVESAIRSLEHESQGG
ncbi:MAG: hypothetical protein OXC09_08925 [Truepera sp.]|nr:hypothetical protein [Truepera sp.]